MSESDQEHQNENGAEWDPTAVDVHELAGVVVRVEIEQRRQSAEQARHGRMLEKICQALGIEPEKSDPPPQIRKTLDSLREEDERLKKADAETSQQIAAVTKEVAETRLDVRFGLIKGIPRLHRAIGALTAAILALVLLGRSIWEVVKHGW